MEKFDILFQVCLILGFALPCLNLLVGFFDGLDGVADLDMDLNGDGGIANTFLNFNFMCFMLAVGIFGILGKVLLGQMALGLVFLIAGGSGALGYAAIYRLVFLPLSRNREKVESHTFRDLIGKDGVLILQITKEHNGTVQTTDSTGAAITYVAAATEEELEKHNNCMPLGMQVRIVDVSEEKRCCYVEKAGEKFVSVLHSQTWEGQMQHRNEEKYD